MLKKLNQLKLDLLKESRELLFDLIH